MKTLEIWKDIEGYEGLYKVNTFGDVFSCRRKKCIKPRKTKQGYLRAHLSKNGRAKDLSIHRLVANAFIPNPDNLPQINHIDENKFNNSVENLAWCSLLQNINHGTCIERTHQKQRKSVICEETGNIYASVSEVNKAHGFSISYVSRVCRGERKTAYGFHWRYV